ncbi:MAG: type VI secretion system tube protein Hcp [Pyrinomonadaceae bacterium]
MATDIFIKIEGPALVGECKVKGYEGWIEASSFGQNVHIPRDASGSGQATGRATVSEFSVSSEEGCHSNYLINAICQNTHYDKITVHFVKQQPGDGAGVKAYKTQVVDHAFVSMYSTQKGSDMKGHESWGFGGQKTEWEYFEQADNGLIGASKGLVSWDIAASA